MDPLRLLGVDDRAGALLEKTMDETRITGTARNIGDPARRRRLVLGSLMILLVGVVMTSASRAEKATPSTSSNGQSQASTDQQGQDQSNTGSLDTHSAGATAAGPQGDTPPGMQPVPSESKKTSPPR
jgi:hypothetical protein